MTAPPEHDRRIRAALAVGAVLTAAAVTVTVLQLRSFDGDTVDGGPAVAIRTPALGGHEPGDLVSVEDLPASGRLAAARIQSARIVYRSTEGDTGAVTTVSGAVFIPPRNPPRDGWPVVALGHGTLGIDAACAPSTSPNLRGLTASVATIVDRGFAVAMPDYQGLGSPGIHPYLDARTAGFNIIDSVRALRSAFPDISTQWAGFGGSQGGGAIWAANELAEDYAPELELVGTSALAPSANLVGLVERSENADLTRDQALTLVAVVESLGRLDGDLDRDDYRSARISKDWDVLLSCSDADSDRRSEAVENVRARDLRPRTTTAAGTLERQLREWSVPQAPLSAPLSVVYGAEDTFIDPAWTDQAVRDACRIGGRISAQLLAEKGHGDIDPIPQLDWIEERFAGAKSRDDCPSLTGSPSN